MKNKQTLAIYILSALVALLCATSVGLLLRLRATASPRATADIGKNTEPAPQGEGGTADIEEQKAWEIAKANKEARAAAKDLLPLAVLSAEANDSGKTIEVRVGPEGGSGLFAPEENAVSVLPAVEGPCFFTINPSYKAYYRIFVEAGFKPDTLYTITLGAGWSNSVGRVLEKPAKVVVRTPKAPPQFSFVRTGLYYPASREFLKFPVRARSVTNLSVVVKRAYESNLPVFGFNEYAHFSYGRRAVVARGNLRINTAKDAVSDLFMDLGQILTNPAPGYYQVSVDTGERTTHGGDGYRWQEKVEDRLEFALTDLAVQFAAESPQNRHAYAFVTSIGTGKPVADAEVVAYTRSCQAAGTGKTDARGLATIELDPRYDYDGSEPIVGVSAKTASDFAYLDVNRYDTEMVRAYRDDYGNKDARAIRQPCALVFSERGICRPGEPFESAVFVRGAAKRGAPALAETPIELKCHDAAGNLVEARRLRTDALGFARTTWKVPGGAEIGAWRVECVLGGEVVGSLCMPVASYVPDRFRVKLEPFEAEAIGLETPMAFKGRADFYFGEPVSIGSFKLSATARPARMPRRWKGWEVGQGNVEQKTFVKYGDLSDGAFSVSYPGLLAGNEVRQDSTFTPVALDIVADVQEAGGRNVSESKTVTIFPTAWFLGIRETKGAVLDDVSYDLTMLPALAGEGEKAPLKDREVKVSLMREEWRRHYVGNGGHIKVEWEREQVAMPRLDRSLDIPSAISPASWTGRLDYAASELPSGRYTLTATLGNAIATKIDFWHWTGEVGERSANPSSLSLEAGASSYRPGETAILKFKSAYKGTAYVIAGDAGIDAASTHSVTQGENAVAIAIPAETLSGYYYAAISLATEDAPDARRLHGVARIKIDTSHARRIDVGLAMPEKARPGETVDITVTLRDAAGRPVDGLVKIGAIDEGAAALTDFHAPDAFSHFFARDYGRPFACYDFFSRICPDLKLLPNGKFGGDGPANFSLRDNRENGTARQKETARLALAPVSVPTGGVAVVKATLPDHIGALRVTAVAGNATAAGSAEETLVMRNRISVLPTAPRFAVGGDRFRLSATLFNHEAEAGEWTLELALPDGMSLAGGAKAVRTGRLEKGASRVETFDVEIAETAPGAKTIGLSLSLGGDRVADELPITLRPLRPVETQVKYFAATNGVLEFPGAGEDWHPGVRSAVELSGSPAYGVAAALQWLGDYPYGCLEQVTAAAFPFLVADDLVKLGLLDEAGRAHAAFKVKVAYANILQMYLGNGSFAMWPGLSDPWEYGTLFAHHFIFEAEKAGLVSPGDDFRANAIRRLRSLAQTANPKSRLARGYAAYILATAGDELFINTARNIVSSPENDFATFLAAAAMLRGGFAYEGVEPFNQAVKAHAWETDDEWDRVKNLGMALFVAAKAGVQDPVPLMPIVTRLNAALRPDASAWGTTRDNAWASLGLASFAARLEGGKSFGRLTRRLDASDPEVVDFEVSEKPATIRLDGGRAKIEATGPVFARLKTTGIPRESKLQDGPVSISRSYVDSLGRPVKNVKKGELVTAVLTISSPADIPNAVLVDLVPGGFEMEDSSLATRAEAGAFKPENPRTPQGRAEIRDDRWLWFGHIGPSAGKNTPCTLSYSLRAVVPGTYAVPAASIEDMYNPDVRGDDVCGGTLVIE